MTETSVGGGREPVAAAANTGASEIGGLSRGVAATAAVVYRSRTGTTRRFAEEIGAHLRERGVETTVASVGDADLDAVADVDLLLLGSWTNGLFVVLQHPDGPWVSFARALPRVRGRVGLFTTYRLAVGSMFGRMRAELKGRTPDPTLELASRDGRLSDRGRAALDRFVSGG